MLSSTVTEQVAVTVFPPMVVVPVIVAVPSAFAVTTPLELTEATEDELLVHVALLVTVLSDSCTPLKYVFTVIASDCVSPVSRVAEDGEITPT